MKKRPPWVCRGFTLVEIMIAVAIIGIVAAMAAPGFIRQMRENHFIGAQDRVYAVLMAARMEAISTSSPVAVSMQSSAIEVSNAGTVKTVSLELPNYVTVSFDSQAGSFHPDGSFHIGSSRSGMTCTITCSLLNRNRTVKVWPTGRISSSN